MPKESKASAPVPSPSPDQQPAGSVDQRRRGLVNKYRVERADGTRIADEARFFVLRLDKDPYSAVAALAYAEACAATHPYLAADLLVELGCSMLIRENETFRNRWRATRGEMAVRCPEVGERLAKREADLS